MRTGHEEAAKPPRREEIAKVENTTFSSFLGAIFAPSRLRGLFARELIRFERD
jgi:hypothetical protein